MRGMDAVVGLVRVRARARSRRSIALKAFVPLAIKRLGTASYFVLGARSQVVGRYRSRCWPSGSGKQDRTGKGIVTAQGVLGRDKAQAPPNIEQGDCGRGKTQLTFFTGPMQRHKSNDGQGQRRLDHARM